MGWLKSIGARNDITRWKTHGKKRGEGRGGEGGEKTATYLRPFCSSDGPYTVQHPLVVPQLQTLLYHVHRGHNGIVKHGCSCASHSSAGWVVTGSVDPETILTKSK